MKKCPFCAEEIQDDAVVCRYCERDLTDDNLKVFVPKCPICGSTDIEKISATNKVTNAVLWGVFAMGTISKTYRCNNCGSKW